MSDITTKSTRLSETVVGGEFKPLGPSPHYVGDEIIVMRCAETIAEVFSDWAKRSKIDENSYVPFDVNSPIELPRRPTMLKAYTLDPPITETGKIASKMMARERCDRRAVPSVIFCSPDFASVETAHLIHSYIGENQACDIDKKAPLAPVAEGVTLVDLVGRVKRAYYELTSKVENALFVVDPLSIMIISSLFYPVHIRVESSLELERLRSHSQFPPLCNVTAYRAGGSDGVKMHDLTNTCLRPLTFSGFSNEIELD
uniref:Uncharacterized protein n=1 Tax=Caenorhabditis japonica TaxID=281687 RepID=A0A8R1DU57_CAEJA